MISKSCGMQDGESIDQSQRDAAILDFSQLQLELDSTSEDATESANPCDSSQSTQTRYAWAERGPTAQASAKSLGIAET